MAKSTPIITADCGTVSHGTLRDEDLFPAFIDELEHQISRQTFPHSSQFAAERRTLRECRRLLKSAERVQWDWSTDEELGEAISEAINETLPNALNGFASSFCSFGSHPGDGSDFGYWFDSESFETACHDGEVTKLDEIPANTIAVVNDHGNVTLYAVTLKEIASYV